MANVPVTIACGNYDRTRAIRDGTVKVEGCDVTYPAALSGRDFPPRLQVPGIRHLGTVVLELHPHGGRRHIGLYRHSRLSCRGSSAIPASISATAPASKSLKTLRGKRIGVPEYQITAVVWMRGLMQHEYGVKPSEIHWRSGGQEQPGRHERTPLKPIPGLDLQPIGDDRTLVGMLRAGELDALFTARAPSSFLAGEPHIARLFPNTRAAEQAYYKKTRLFPIMHLVGIRKTLAEKYPWLPTSVL